MRDADGRFSLPTILDVISIDFITAQPTPTQPENWKISGADWIRVGNAGHVEFQILKDHISTGPELFRGYERCVSSEEVQSRPHGCSLALVRPSALRWHPELNYYGRKRFRGEFCISGHTYDLPLTDDAYTATLLKKRDCELENGASDCSVDLALTISLGDLFAKTGCYHKLIAGVVELPHTSSN
jgi:hypothetical protein